ncbi:DUF2987 domain-containing protein [Shewanella psychropiezotolerans]|uniref:DUF2987 domain-containing protein n=1 Tax=Shewanella psychropiezotolerans TaxID=2593655 RepID=A0ABX5WZK0_9GAMM|nr:MULTISPECIES: DUF2987 domain-containing protein [Shewanella]MPY23891.1 DUF2987 domain-containing protein [Shewanella sp. YLB-07]QDO84183.1 DUF2987 domain-containing protein [Shewanella psychropiezotolerans]
MKKGLLFSCLLVAVTSVQAAPISIPYQGFYQRLKQVNKGNYPLIEIAFSVPDKSRCLIKSGTLTTEKESFPLTITEDQRIFLPYDARLKSDRALVNLDIEGSADNCSISMQVRAKNTKQSYSQKEVQEIQAEMNTMLSDMQGFPMRYFSQDIAGVNFEFEPDSKTLVYIDGKEQIVTDKLRLSSEQIDKLSDIKFDAKPLVISPWTNG